LQAHAFQERYDTSAVTEENPALRNVMRAVTSMIPWGLVVAGGGGLFFLSLFGTASAIAMGLFGAGSDSILKVTTTVLSLTLAFPIFLLGQRSLRIATWVLWVFFALQWLNWCFLARQLVSPFEWFYSDALFVSILLVHAGYLLLPRVPRKEQAPARPLAESPQGQ
jgi:hypothetical protein